MLNRRLIRIKVFKVLYSSANSSSATFAEARKNLTLSCEKTLHLYYFMLNAAVALKEVANEKIENGLMKFNPTAEEKNPNRKFVENKFSALLEGNEEFMKFCEDHALLWNDDMYSLVRKLYTEISERDYFKAYMDSEERSLKEDCELFFNIYMEEFEDNEDLASDLEDMSLFWMDDLGFVLNVILRNIDFLKSKGHFPKVNVFMKDDDEEFAYDLLKAAYTNYDKYMDMIYENVSNWDSERIVSTDLTLIVQGIAEAIAFPNIPIKVTINEYVEISKYYSTENSNVFVNGLLDKIFQKLTASGQIQKKGRGLIDK